MKKNLFIKSIFIFTLILVISCKEKTPSTEMVSVSTSYRTSLDYDRTVLQILDQSPVYNSFLKLVNAVEYFDEIRNMNNVMVFVPTDEAFGPSKYLINELSSPENLDRLVDILEYHFVRGDLDAENLQADLSAASGPIRLKTINGGYLAFRMQKGKLSILDESTGVAFISKSSIRGSNGVVFTIDRVLRPNRDNTTKPGVAMSRK
ncbi:fasciclin domain-containing protein [Muriicola marianensis]|uniref:FAS1 domain-containing protein n=1 Tax=Muriicola marianensis TaxID=1324801 RepID=A0ABQ1QR27_9FLAO|nr:fasciclin domain-containing protein [Muriicola marianensis]GGD41658.1 hypothetical protein GCM10011361_05920 [Muriicola marianensis]